MHDICILSNLIVYLYIKSLEPAATDKRRYIMTTYIYKGQEINHTSFISILRSAGINGGRKLTHYQVLEREAANGNEKAIEILKNLIIKEETIVKKYIVSLSVKNNQVDWFETTSLQEAENQFEAYKRDAEERDEFTEVYWDECFDDYNFETIKYFKN